MYHCILLLFLICSLLDITYAKNRTFELEVKQSQLNPDCYQESYSVPTINGEFPAPALRVVKDDFVEIVVINKADEPVSIHFHGIRQYGTPFSDGVAGITQLAIQPGERFVHRFQVKNQVGTYFYHGHVKLEDQSIQGPFIVYECEESLLKATFGIQGTITSLINDGPFRYHDERILQWSEWWHQPLEERYNYYMGKKYRFENQADSFLLNGKTVFNDSSVIDEKCSGFEVIDVEPNKIYRLRFIGSLTHRTLGILIQDHPMSLIEIDGEYIQPKDIDYVELSPGQRMSVLIKTGSYPDGTIFPIASNIRLTNNNRGYSPNGYGYLRYGKRSDEEKKIVEAPALGLLPKVFLDTDTPGWIFDQLRPFYEGDLRVITGEATRTLKFAMQEYREEGNLTRFRNNGREFIHWGTKDKSLLDIVAANPLSPESVLEEDGFSIEHQTYPVGHMEIVDLVFQNVKIKHNGVCLTHPWHTHGHSHYLIAEGEGDYNHDLHKDIRTYSHPILKDVSMVYPRRGEKGIDGCGWTKVRILTDNPGLWAVHCHVTAHMIQGKIIVLEEAPELLSSILKSKQ